MNNPYKILGLPQDANASQIVRAQISALKIRKYNMTEITEAQAILRKPSTRLAADFTFPILDEIKAKPIISKIHSVPMNLDKIDPNKFDSLSSR